MDLGALLVSTLQDGLVTSGRGRSVQLLSST
jgi:hypothetical protein